MRSEIDCVQIRRIKRIERLTVTKLVLTAALSVTTACFALNLWLLNNELKRRGEWIEHADKSIANLLEAQMRDIKAMQNAPPDYIAEIVTRNNKLLGVIAEEIRSKPQSDAK